MEILSKSKIKDLLNNGSTRLKKSLGQHYLISIRSINSFLSHLKESEQIIEIGPGIGNISINYFKDFKRVFLIEIDEEKIDILRNNLTEANNGIYPKWVEIINEDILKIDLFKIIDKELTYQVIGALPYNISKQIIRKNLELFPAPLNSIFIVQKEVADKYTQELPNESFLSVNSKLFARIKREEIIKRADFYPIPKIDSRIIVIDNYLPKDEEELIKLSQLSEKIKKGFSNPRKKLSNVLEKENINNAYSQLLEKRPQELSVDDWKSIFSFT